MVQPHVLTLISSLNIGLFFSGKMRPPKKNRHKQPSSLSDLSNQLLLSNLFIWTLVVIVMLIVNHSRCCEPLGSGFKVALIGGEMVEINHWHFDTEQKLPVAKRNTSHKVGLGDF